MHLVLAASGHNNQQIHKLICVPSITIHTQGRRLVHTVRKLRRRLVARPPGGQHTTRAAWTRRSRAGRRQCSMPRNTPANKLKKKEPPSAEPTLLPTFKLSFSLHSLSPGVFAGECLVESVARRRLVLDCQIKGITSTTTVRQPALPTFVRRLFSLLLCDV